MVGKITYFKTEDFNSRGVFNQFHSECQINNLTFRKGDTLTHQDIPQVLDTCKKHNKFGVNTLVIKGESDLTIWIEQTSQSKSLLTTEQNTSSQEAQNPAPNTSASLPTKVVTKRYRGQVYEETVVDWAAVAIQKQQASTENKSRRKYRGNYID